MNLAPYVDNTKLDYTTELDRKNPTILWRWVSLTAAVGAQQTIGSVPFYRAQQHSIRRHGLRVLFLVTEHLIKTRPRRLTTQNGEEENEKENEEDEKQKRDSTRNAWPVRSANIARQNVGVLGLLVRWRLALIDCYTVDSNV